MTTIEDLTLSLIGQGVPIEGMNSAGVPHVITGETLSAPQIALVDSEFAIWDAQTDKQKNTPIARANAKSKAIAIKNALNSISDPSSMTLSSDLVVYDTDGTTPLLTVPDDTTWAGMSNADVKTFIREFTLTYARVLAYAVAQKDGYLDIKKYIDSEINDD